MKRPLVCFSIGIAILSILMALGLSGLAREAGAFWRYQNPDYPDLPLLPEITPALMKVVTLVPLTLLVTSCAMSLPTLYRERLLFHLMAMSCLIILFTGFLTLISAAMPWAGGIIQGMTPIETGSPPEDPPPQ